MIENLWVYIALIFSTFVNVTVPLPGTQAVGLLALITDPHVAIALASFYFMLSGIIRITLFWRDIQWMHVQKLLPLSAIGAVLGALALFSINDQLLLVVIIAFSIYFLWGQLSKSPRKDKSHSHFTTSITGLLSGFLQGTGLSGSDLRNNYLYSRGVSLVQLQGTTAIMGATNFLIATVIRLAKQQITIPDLSPFLIIFPFMVVGSFLGRYVLRRIDKRYGDVVVIIIMSLTIIFLIYKFVSA